MVGEASSLTVQERTGQLHRIQGVDSADAREVLVLAYHAMEPGDQTQRQAFSALMPELYMLRRKGFTFQQITALMVECGFRLQVSTVRNYFSEMLHDRQEECVRRFDEQMVVLAEIHKVTKGAEVSSIAGKVAAITARQQGRTNTRVEAVFGGGANAPRVVDTMDVVAPGADAPGGRLPEKQSALRADPPSPASAGEDDVDSGFGLAVRVASDVPVVSKIGNAFFDGPGDPVVPDLSGEVSTNLSSGVSTGVIVEGNNDASGQGRMDSWRCLPLQSGVKPLARRAGLPEEVYCEGLLEHPAIAGLMLSLDERLYGALLEINENGKSRLETVHEKGFRIKWKKPIPMTPSATAADFVQMNTELFRDVGKKPG